MPFVVVITAVVIVNNGDDNAWCFVSVLSFVVFFCCSIQTGFVGRRAAAAGRETNFLTSRVALCYCDPLVLNLKLKMKTPDAEFICL